MRIFNLFSSSGGGGGGGLDLKKNFVDLFFWFCLNFCAAGKILKIQVIKSAFKHFLEIFDQKNRVFLARAHSSKLVYSGVFRKTFGLVSQIWIYPFGRQGVESLKRGGVPLPKSAPV